MMEETSADANCPCDYVESGATEDVGIQSSQPIPPGAGGGARSHRVVGGLWPTGQGHRGCPVYYPQEGCSLAQAIPGAGDGGVGEGRAPPRPHAYDQSSPGETGGDHDYAATAGEGYSLVHTHHGG